MTTLASSILVETSDAGVRTITLNRPDRLNAVDPTLAEQLPQYIRAATTEERFQHGQDYIVDNRFARAIQHTASLRKTAAQTATASQDAANKNARTLAQAAMNRRGTPQPGKRPQQHRPTTPQSNPSKKAWDLMENLAAGRVGTASE